MARPTYPSDHRRWFRVMEDILDDPKLGDGVSADVFRFYFRLLAMLNRTKSRDGAITLGRRALNLCAGREQLRHSLRVARGGALAGLYTLSVDGAQTLITVPNWPNRQEYAPAKLRPDSGETPATTPKTTPKTNTPPRSARGGHSPPPDPFQESLIPDPEPALETPDPTKGSDWKFLDLIPPDAEPPELPDGTKFKDREEWFAAHVDLIRAEAEAKTG